MSIFHEAIKQVLADVDRFLNITLRDEKLSTPTQKEKSRILDGLRKLYEEYDILNPHQDDGSSNSSKGLADESRFTSTSNHSHGSEEDGYTDNIPHTTVKELKGHTKMGYLHKKPTEFFEKFSKQKKYCVIHKNIMYWFKKYTDKNQQAAIFLTGYEFKDLTVGDKEFVFELSSAKKKCFQFQADSKEELEEWRKAVETGMKYVEPVAQPAVQEEDDNFGEEYDFIGDIADTVRKANQANVPSASMPPGMLNTVPTSPHPKEPSVTDMIYDEGTSMTGASVTKQEDQQQEEIIADDDEIYEFVDAPPINTKSMDAVNSSTASTDEMRSSIPLTLPPRPPTSPLAPQASQEPPPLPSRNPNIPAPPKSPASIPKRCPKLDIASLTEDYENLFYGIWSCVGDSVNELSFDRGDIVHVLNRDLDSENWWIGECSGQIGLVPKHFLSPAYELVA